MNATFPVVAELVRRGERVVYFATEPFRDRVTQAGAEYVSYGDPATFVPPAHTGGLYSVMAWSMGLAETMLPGLLERLREIRPDYLLIDSMCVWGALARQVLRLPAAMLASVFVPNPGVITVDEMVRRAYGDAPKEVLLAGIGGLDTYLQTAQRIDRRWGTQSPNMVEFFANRQQLNVVFTSREFHLAGDSYDASYRFTGPTLLAPDRCAESSCGEAPLVYISLGTIFNDRPDFYRACFSALGEEACRVVLVTGTKVDQGALGPAPANFTLCEHADQLALLRPASVFVTHGGMNGASEALWYGVPLLVFPQHGDQHLVAERVAALGAGLVLRPPDPGAETLRGTVRRLLEEPAFRECAQTVGQSFRAAGGWRRASDEILAWRAS